MRCGCGGCRICEPTRDSRGCSSNEHHDEGNNAMSLTEREVAAARGTMSRWWWLFLVTGIAWVLVGLVVLSADAGTPRLIGYFTGFVLLFAGVTELAQLGFV